MPWDMDPVLQRSLLLLGGGVLLMLIGRAIRER